MSYVQFVQEKTEANEELFLPNNLNSKNLDEFDDVYLDAAASSKSKKKMEERQDKKIRQDALLRHKTLEGCAWCLGNKKETKHLIVSTGSKCYLCLPQEESLNEGHCIIVPVQHEMSTRELDEDIWDEIKNYKIALTKMFLEKDMDVVFFESARSFRHYPHCFVQCVPLDKEIGELSPIYFQVNFSFLF